MRVENVVGLKKYLEEKPDIPKTEKHPSPNNLI